MIPSPYKYLPLLLLFGLSWPGSVSLAAEPERTFRTMTVMRPVEGLKYELDGKACGVPIERGLSDPLPLPDGPLEIYRLLPPPPGSPPGREPERQVVAMVEIPPAASRAIIFFLKDRSGRVRARAYEDGYDVHGAGTMRIFNLSTMDSALNIGDQIYPVPSGKTGFAPYESGPILVKIAVRGGDQWSIAYRKGRIAYPELRAYAVLFDFEADPYLTYDAPTRPATIRVFTETVPEDFR